MRTELQKYILNKLLSRYERSKTYLSGPSARRILLSVADDPELAGLFEDADSRKELIRVLEELKETDLLDFSWVRFEKGNLVDRIWLNTEEDAIARSSALAGRSHGKRQAQILAALIADSLGRIRNGAAESSWEGFRNGAQRGTCQDVPEETGGRAQDGTLGDGDSTCDESKRQMGLTSESRDKITDFLKKAQKELEEKKKIPRFFYREETEGKQKEAMEKNRKLLKLLEALALNRHQQQERVLSTRLYGDSKVLEHEIKSKLLSILRYIEKDSAAEMAADETADEELLSAYGLVKWPEILEFCGNLAIETLHGTVDFSPLYTGACMNTGTLDTIQRIRLNGVRRILTIENKANYTEYIRTERKEEELVIYHGGFLSPTRRAFLKLILETATAGKNHRGDIDLYHWGDIDLGGFSMLLQLKHNISPAFQAFRMDRQTLEENMGLCMKIIDDDYLKHLARLKEDTCSDSHMAETIDYMLQYRIRLEQENLL